MTAPIDTSCAKWGPIWLAPGISRLNMWTLIYAAFFTIGLLTFVGVGTPYVLSANLHIPPEQQGVLTGNLVFWTEIVAILMFGPIGLLVDRYGRRALYVIGFLILGAGYALYPWARTVFELTLARIIYAIGVSFITGVLATVVTDYPQEATRGKLVAITGFMNGLGISLLNFAFSSIPKALVNAGFDDVTAGRYAHLIVAAVCVVSAVVVGLGLKGGLPTQREEKVPILVIAREAISAAKNPRIALAYSAAFIARGDLVILGSFLTLWGKNAGVEAGMSIADASQAGTRIFVIAQSAALLWIGAAIFLLDRFNRVNALTVCMALATVGYLAMGFVSNPLAPVDLPLILLLGIGQISAFIGSQSLVGQEAPIGERGAILGGFNTAGAIGILFCSIVGGYLFDAVSPRGPFILVGAINAMVFVLCLIVRAKAPGRAAAQPTT